MALDVFEMEAEEMTCPHCNKPVLMRWQMATYAPGQDSPQFLGLEKAASADALRTKTYRPRRRVSFLARRGDQPPRRVTVTIRDAKTLSEVRCPICNSRMRNAGRRRYYCSHCKKRYKVVLETIKAKVVPA